ncbi:hypothetical protein SRHO_G00195170 [Serrasalmus rhombeus]
MNLRKPVGGRSLHQSTISFGDQTKTSYSTTHTESFSGRSCDGQPLIFQQKSAGSVDLSTPTGSSYGSTHSRDVHSPKDVMPQSVLRDVRTRNRIHNWEGLIMKEITNPLEATPYRSSYHTEHCSPAASAQPTGAAGQAALWHQHNILTGEDGGPVGPGNPRRQSRERLLWAARCRETDRLSLCLY